MSNWSSELSEALGSGDPQAMRAVLATVPAGFMHLAQRSLEELAHAAVKNGEPAAALSCYDCLAQAAPGRLDWQADRVALLLALDRRDDALAAARRVTELAPDSAVGYCLQADAHIAAGELPQGLAALREALGHEPDDDIIRQRVRDLEARERSAGPMPRAPAPDAPLRIELPPPPRVAFDPALLDDPALPAASESFRIDGLRQHLRRYSAQLSPGNAIARLEDPAWLDAWDRALAGVAGQRMLFCGSELGVLALRALHHGATHALCIEQFPLDARIATGMAQKRFLAQWHAHHGASIRDWPAQQRRASFEEFASPIDIAVAGDDASAAGRHDCLVFPRIDHTLLGTGIVRAVRRYLAREGGKAARVLPARATVFAMGVEWRYPGADLGLQPMNRLRWSMSPQALELEPGFWTALTEPVRCGEIDFAGFSETVWDRVLPVTRDGNLDAVLFWFDLDLGDARISNAPGAGLQCVKPAVQYTDPIAVQAGAELRLAVRVEENRLLFQTRPAAALARTYSLPSWYVPMMGDQNRSRAYRDAIAAALAGKPAGLVLDIGSGCGLLSAMAVEAGAQTVVGCETHPAVLEAGREIVARKGMDGRITMVGKDCRELGVPDDLPRRADLALFELFDSSLIGEGILHFLAHARQHLLTPDARYLPAGARIRAMVVEYHIDRIWDIDASLLNAYRSTPSFSKVDAGKLAYRPLSEPFDVFDFDFATAGPSPEEEQLRPVASAAGLAGALLFWFDLRLDGTRWISNDPRSTQSHHWKQGLKVLPELRVEEGGVLPLSARHDGSRLDFRWLQDELPEEAMSQVPRFDPRWLAANGELEHQTRGLLQHCASSPDEYLKVAEIAKRLAVDPGAHDIDPAVAERFATMFLN